MQPVMQYTDERPSEELRLRVWPGEGEFSLYEDDGHSFEYRQGAWSITRYRVSTDNDRPIVQIKAREGQWTPPARTLIVEVVGVGEQSFTEDGNDHTLTF